MFENLRKEVEKEYREGIESKVFYITNGYVESWSDEHKQESDNGIKEWSTDTRYNQFKKGIIDREHAVYFAIERMTRSESKKYNARLEKLNDVFNTVPAEYINITVEWTKSSTWGNNPHAEVRTSEGVYYGTASGCGYDKESASVANALNQDYSVLHIIYAKEDKRLANVNNISRRDFVGYGSGYGVLPSFEGGVGMSAHRAIFEKCGYSTEQTASGKTFDVYRISKENKQEKYHQIFGIEFIMNNDFRENCLTQYPNAEVRNIENYLKGDNTLIIDKDFSALNLEVIKKAIESEETKCTE